MFSENYKWNYDYVRLVSESSFAFERHKTDDFDKNKISLIDIDRLIKERDIETVEKFIPCVTQFILDEDQAQILDNTFVKIFKLSQLSISYLLFCKKYLDSSLTQMKEQFMKIKEENKELNLFVEDLKEHIAALMKEIKEKTATIFKCEQCNKVFSSEEFLNSHIKRRHSEPLREIETDKLHSEIKELKGRLNSAEQLIQRETHLKPVHDFEETQSKKVDVLQQKFEELRVQVQSELKILQTQHHFQEKYEELFEKMASKSASLQDTRGAGDLPKRRDSFTQTDIEAVSTETETVKSVETENKKEAGFDITQKQIMEFGGALETKVTTSLEKIENQMQSFWNKLSEMEIHRNKTDDREKNQVPPIIKPRSKYTVAVSTLKEEEKSSITENSSSKRSKSEQSPQPVKKVKTKPQPKIVKKNIPNLHTAKKIEIQSKPASKKISSSSTSSESESETLSEPPRKETAKVTKSPLKAAPSVVKTRPILPEFSNKTLVVDDELFKHFKDEVEKISVMGRLQDLGVSPEWKGLPHRSFSRAMEIVKHQASLMKKTYPDFDVISAEVERKVAKKLQEINIKNQGLKKIISKNDKKIKIISSKSKVPSPRIEIKNRKVYETDSESDEPVKLNKIKENFNEFSAPYSAVIEELKSVTTKVDSSDKSELSSIREDNEKHEDQTKGVLKSNFPSLGSLTKKKVLFNLDNEDRFISNKDGGSTTSIASSVLDGTPRKLKKHVKQEKDIEDLSDFDFSDM